MYRGWVKISQSETPPIIRVVIKKPLIERFFYFIQLRNRSIFLEMVLLPMYNATILLNVI